MKRVFIGLAVIAISACLAVTAVAQDQPSSGQNQQQGHMGHERGPMASPDQMLQRMTRQLNLTSDQQDKIRPILESQSKQMQDLRQDTSLTRQDRMSKMRQIHDSTMSQIKGVLNPDQQQKLEKMNHRGGPRGPRTGNGSNPQ